MKQQEKTRRTQERILTAAIAEFGTKSYDTASINTICSENNLSKGLIYHNFKSKDELYLQCVKISYDKMLAYLEPHSMDYEDVRTSMQKMLELRQQFFQDNPYYANIFFNTILQPPVHLLASIRQIRKKFDDFLIKRYRLMIHHLDLKEGITEDMALDFLMTFHEMFNGYFQSKIGENKDYHELIEAHEGKLSQMLDIILYGIAAPKNVNDSHRLEYIENGGNDSLC